MVINNYKGGQLGNGLLLFAHFIANSIEYDYSLVNFEFDEFEPFFESSKKNDFNGYPISVRLYKNKLKSQLIRRSARLWTDITNRIISSTPWYKLYRIFKTHDSKGIEFDLNNEAFIKDAQTEIVIVQGWGFRDHRNLTKHAEIIRSLFIPVKKYKDEVEKLLTEMYKEANLVYAVHIRRGDYIKFDDGKYYFSDDVYADKMIQLYEDAKLNGTTCAFIICSNEQIKLENFPAELKLFIGNRHPIVDMYAMAACDGIIGPPSTFSGWASFYGKVPVQHLYNKDDKINLKNYLKSL